MKSKTPLAIDALGRNIYLKNFEEVLTPLGSIKIAINDLEK